MTDYGQPLREQDVDPDPLRQFALWFGEAVAAGLRLPEAAALATASVAGVPSVRMVLVKEFDERGFVFYSNYESRKGAELAANPTAALLFHWDQLGRQIRIEGAVQRTSAERDGRLRAQPATRQPAQRAGLSAESDDRQPRGPRATRRRAG